MAMVSLERAQPRSRLFFAVGGNFM